MIEQVGRFGLQVPERPPGYCTRAIALDQVKEGRADRGRGVGEVLTPERVLLVNPLALSDVVLPAVTHRPERLDVLVGRVGKQMAVDHLVDQPFEVCIGHVRHEPGEPLAVEPDL